MPVHGFRLFVAELAPERGQSRVDFSECGERHYQDVVADTLGQMMDQTLVTAKRQDTPIDAGDGSGDDDVPEDPLAGRKGFSLRKLRADGRLLYGEALVGTFGGHEEALEAPPEGEPELVEVSEASDTDTVQPPAGGLDLRRRAPARRFRFVLCLPEKGTQGILGVEDISGSCPRTLLRELINKTAKDRADAALGAGATLAAVARQPKAVSWWRLDITAALDEQHFKNMLDRGQLDRVELVRKAITSDGSREKTDLKVIAPILDATTKATAFIGLAKTWAEVARSRRRPEGRRPRRSKEEREQEDAATRNAKLQSDRDGAGALAALVDPTVAQIEFDDGWLVVEDGEKTKKISPSRVSELFVYEINRKRQPTALEFYLEVRAKALALADPLQLALEWPASPSINDEE